MKSTKVVSNKDETIALFDNPFLEKFTHIHPAMPVIIYLPVVGYFIFETISDGILGVGMSVTLFTGGILVWTLTEYVFHRFIFHYEPRSRFGRDIHFLMHGVHHAYPRDSQRLVMAPVVSLPLAILFYGIFVLTMDAHLVPPFFAGFIFGYICYDLIHYATHHFPMRGKFGLWLKHHHMRHHYQDDTFGYGVSSPLWDWVLRTDHPQKSEKAERESVEV